MTIWTYIVSGGPVMVPICGLSVVAAAVVLERMWVVRRGRVVPQGFGPAVLAEARAGRWERCEGLCQAGDSAAARVLGAMLGWRHLPRADVRTRVEEVARREALDLESHLPLLSTIATVEPLLGLLGTVGGMILTFEMIAEDGVGTAQNLATGISQALVTTFGGLAVAIPIVLLHRLFLGRIDAWMGELEEICLSLLDVFEAERRE